ncbi:MAG: hypothetical protein AABZ55_02000, partial [Bdellovibrionota bacterium]
YRFEIKNRKLNIGWLVPISKNPIKRDCAMPFSYVHLDNLGNLGACCMRPPDGDLYGNIFTEEDAWNRPYYIHLRRTMMNSQLKPQDICKNCDNLCQDLYQI